MSAKPWVIVGILAGFVAGWQTRSAIVSPPVPILVNVPAVNANSYDSRLPQQYQNSVPGQQQFRPVQAPYRPQALAEETQPEKPDQEVAFKGLLDTHRYRDAMDLYRSTESSGDIPIERLKSTLEKYLKTLISTENTEDFTELTDRFLAYYYDDIDVLLLLADFNQSTGLFLEAINVYQIVDSYAYTHGAAQKVLTKFERFLHETNEALEYQNDWFTLKILYQQAEALGLIKDNHRLRQAQVYIKSGESYYAREILLALQGNHRWGEDAKELLTQLDGGAEATIASAPPPRSSDFDSHVALQKHGNQFVIPLGLTEDSSLNLLIDTGASMTTISRDRFDQLSRHDNFTEVGHRMFRTANGLTKGTVYNAEHMRFGSYTLHSMQIAVLEFNMGGDIAGLLGMNILGRFRFQMDQEKSELLLTPR